LIAVLISSLLLLLTPSRSEDVFDDLSRLNALDGFLFRGFVSIGDGRPKNVFHDTPREALYEEFDGFWIGKVISSNASEALEVVGVLVDLGPF